MRLGTFEVIFSGLLAVFLFTCAWGGFYTIDERERGVILTNGAVNGEVGSGLHFKRPWIDSIVEINVESRKVRYDKMELYSKDQQPAEMVVSVLYHVIPVRASEVYSRFTNTEGLQERIIHPKVFEQAKNVFGKYDAVTAVQERTKLNADIAKAIHESIGGMNAPVEIEAVQIENIEFSRTYMASIEQRMMASVEVEKFKQNAEREKVTAEINVTRAKGEADSQIARAEANAKSIRLQGDAEASAIKARADALGANPNLVGLTTAEKWNGALPSTMIPSAGVPMISLPKQ